ncbi:MAG: hypothetical protein QOI77_2161 [Blastocatellia bacterium]|jgi:hypothetical protein|nr:hypothetical protein [Blastocatellia bacterium]
MVQSELQSAHQNLQQWCRAQGFAGYDPYDALNSRWFQATPLKRFRIARLAWTQFHKRSPVNFRSLVRIPRERNAKGIALFALSALAEYRRSQTKEAELEARELLDDLMWMRLKGLKGAAWGYNFDWQSRSFFAPRGTPTVVPTAFAARALCEAAEVFGQEEYLPFARTICDFILSDLNRSEESDTEVCFSYSPLDQTRVLNASLLAGETLAVVGKLTGEGSLCDWAMRAARYVARRQRADGSWPYGGDDYQSWADGFHTAFILASLSRIIDSVRSAPGADRGSRASSSRGVVDATGSIDELDNTLRRGYDFWQERFFLADGWPKYYPDRLYPADAHSAASAIVTLVELRGRIPGTMILAEKIAQWAIDNLRDSRGYFHYQRRRFYTVRIPYMRWSQAWTAYALARLLEAKSKK